MTQKAKLFLNGRSQAVRLPVEYRFEGSEVYVRRDPATGDVILSQRPESWADFFELIKEGDVPDDFMKDRKDDPLQKHESLSPKERATERQRMKSLPGFQFVPQDMQDALEKFSDEAQKIVDEFLKNLELQEPPPMIYHYTNEIGLKGILETGKFWLTDIFSLKDPSELRHGFSHAINVLNSEIPASSPIAKKFANNFSAFAQQGLIQKVAHFFLCSFSSCGDDLDQWRAYAEDGRGYALGFDARLLEHGFTKRGSIPILNNSTFYVRYADAQLAEIDRQIINKMLHLILLPSGRNMADAELKVYMTELQMRLTLPTLQAALFFKHEAYKNEKEYRFSQIFRADAPPPDVNLRGRANLPVKYTEFNWKDVSKNALKEIVVGPAADYANASRLATSCLEPLDIGTVRVIPSKIPYRSL